MMAWNGQKTGRYLNAKTGSYQSTPYKAGADSDGAGMDTTDWVGIGMQVAGAITNQKEQDEAKKLEQSRHNEALKLAGRSRTDTLRQQEVENQQATRSQNQKGLEYMTGLVDSNRAASRKAVPSFRQTMLNGGI